MTNFCSVFRSQVIIHPLHVDGWFIISEVTSKNQATDKEISFGIL